MEKVSDDDTNDEMVMKTVMIDNKEQEDGDNKEQEDDGNKDNDDG